MHFSQRIENLNAHNKIKKAMAYSLISNGKYIRPLTFLRFIKSDNYTKETLLDIAMSIECIHVYSLIHDDLPAMDNDTLRRGMPTNHIEFGEDVAILAGDALLTLSFELLSNLDINPELIVKLIQVLAKASGVNQGMINGQVLDILQDKPDLEYLKQVHIQKTGQMLAAPLMMAAILDDGDVQSAKQLGVLIGHTYQIQDDYLDVYGDAKLLGKDTNSDFKNDKTTYLTYYKKDELENLIADNFNQIYARLDAMDVDEDFRSLIGKLDKRSF